MLSNSHKGAISANVNVGMSSDSVHPKPWGTNEDLEWLLNRTEADGSEQSPDLNDQETMTPSTWMEQPATPLYQTFVNSASNDSFFMYQVSQSQPQHPAPVTHPHLGNTHFLGRNYQHQARISVVANPAGGFKTIVKPIKRKRKRTMFTTEQIGYLESFFTTKQYVTREERQTLVGHLGVSDNSVKVWFQNRRIRHKREVEQAYYEDNSPAEEICELSASLEHMEEKLFQKADSLGYVTLDETEMEVIVKAIDLVLSRDVLLRLESNESDQSTTESEASSIYEPISPAASDSTAEEESAKWEAAIAPEQSLQKLFDLHFC